MNDLSEKALIVARSQLGQCEVPRGSNRGPMVDQYLASIGLNPGFAWCCAFVFWCHREAAAHFGAKNLMPKTGGVMDLWNRSVKYRVDKPRAGDVFIIDSGNGKGHTGFVESVRADGSLDTIEGNSNDEGSREGYEVCRHRRTLGNIKGFLRF